MTTHHSVLRLSKRLGFFLPIPGVVAGIAYLLTLSHSDFPGYSTALTAEAAGLIPPSNASHPLFAWVVRHIAALDVFSLPVRLNLFSALCGTLCAMLFYLAVSRLILFSACEDAGGGERADLPLPDDEDEADTLHELPPEVALYNRRMLRIAVGGGLVAALVLVFTAPVWSASTRLDNGMFDLLIALASLLLFPAGRVRTHALRLVLSVFLFALGLCESAVFLLLLPCYAFILFESVWLSPRRVTRGGWIILGGIAAVACSAYAFSQNVSHPESFTLLAVAKAYSRELLTHHYHEALSFFPRSGWLLLLVQLGLPSIMLVFGQKTLFEEKKAITVVVLFLVTFSVAPGLLNLFISPFFVLQAAGSQPVFGYAVIAAAVAVVFSCCLIIIGQEDSPESSDRSSAPDAESQPNLRWLRGCAGGLIPVLAVLVLVTPWRSFHDVDARRGAFADQVACEILGAMKERTCLISNGYLDNHLRIQAFLMNKPLMLVTLRSQTVPQEADQVRQLIATSPVFAGQNRQRLQNALSIGTVRFVMEWFNTDPNAGRRAMVFATPDIWIACGYRAIPEGLAFGGVRADQTLDLEGLVKQNRTFADRVSLLLDKQRKDYEFVASLREMLRMKAGFAANELGVLLEDMKDFKTAYQSYARALEIDPMNVSAAVNIYELASAQGLHPEALDSLRKRVKAASERSLANKARDLTAILQNYGSIRQQAFYLQQTAVWSAFGAHAVSKDKISKALALSKQTGVTALIENALVYLHSGDNSKAEACYLAALEADASNPDALSGMCTLMIGKRNVQEAETWIQKALNAGVGKDRLLYQTITLAILKNDTEQALKLLREATEKYPRDLRYWTMLADALLSRGDTQVVEFQVLPEMQKVLQNPNHFLVYAVRGFLMRKKGPAFYKEARLSLLNALALNAALPEIWGAVFELDMALKNPAFTETDARNLLKVDPDHALANYLMGSSLLARGALQEAEDFLRRSIEKQPTAAACNDLAENLRLEKKLAEAETFARRALEMEHGLLAADDTLACILLDAGKYDEASQLAAKAVAAKPSHAPYQLTLLRSLVKRGDRDGVNERLRILSESKVTIPDALVKEIKGMK